MNSKHDKKQDDVEEQSKEEIVQKDADSEVEPQVSEIQDELDSARNDAKEHYDKLLRVMAEFENFKKRMTREHVEHVQYGNQKLITALLTVIDDFERVIDHIPDDVKGEVKSISDGIHLVHKNFMKVLGDFGLELLDVKGKRFDPSTSEAISYLPDDKCKSDHVIGVERKGYKLHGRIIRPALVMVSKGKTGE